MEKRSTLEMRPWQEHCGGCAARQGVMGARIGNLGPGSVAIPNGAPEHGRGPPGRFLVTK